MPKKSFRCKLRLIYIVRQYGLKRRMSGRRTYTGGKPGTARIKRENRAGMIAILFVVCFLFMVLLLEGFRLRRQIVDNDMKHVELERAIAEEEERTLRIESRREYMKSDDYVRQAAKDRLGLIESGEVIFKSADE